MLDFYLEGVASFMVGSLEPIDYDPEAMLARLVSPAARARQTASGASAVLVRNVLTFLQRVEVVSITPENRHRIEATDLNHDLYPRDEYDRHPVWREPWPFEATP